MKEALSDASGVKEALKAPDISNITVLNKTNTNHMFCLLYIVRIGYRTLRVNLPSFAPFKIETLLFGTKKGDSSKTSRTCRCLITVISWIC